ncbi:MAG: hypothetical protein V4757_07445 [Pseudomonadota bacterium]
MTDNEAFYDAEIAPALMALGARMQERGMSFVATVEYDPDQRGSTFILSKDAGLPMHILHIAAHAGQNFDGLAMGVLRHCQKNGIDTGASMFLSRFDKGGRHE